MKGRNAGRANPRQVFVGNHEMVLRAPSQGQFPKGQPRDVCLVSIGPLGSRPVNELQLTW